MIPNEIYEETKDCCYGLYNKEETDLNTELILDELCWNEFCTDSYKENNKLFYLNERLLNTKTYKEHNDMSYERASVIAATRRLCSLAAFSAEWMKHKCIYTPNNTFASDLIKTDNISLSSNLINRLPYKTFYIDCERISEFKAKGIFIHVKKDEDYNDGTIDILFQPIGDNITTETEIGRDYIPIPIIIYANHTYLYKKEYLNGNFINLCIGKNNLKIKEKINNLLFHRKDIFNTKSEFKDYIGYIKGDGNINVELPLPEDITNIYTFVIQFVLYLSSKNPDIQINKTIKRERDRAVRLGKTIPDSNVWDVGIRYGKKIKLYEEQKMKSKDIKERESRKSPRPHSRCGHWHTYWCGKGKTEKEIIWIEPTYCNGTEITTVIHEVTNKKEKSKYQMENMLYDILTKNGCTVYTQWYEGKIGKFYDAAVPLSKDNEEYLILFETDGEQHFHPVEHFGGTEKFKKQKEADDLKNKFAKENGYPLVRIRYDQIQEMPKIIKDVIKNPEKYKTRLNTILTNEEYYSIRE